MDSTPASSALVLVPRLSVKRMLTKPNAFNLVVTVGRGSTAALVLLSQPMIPAGASKRRPDKPFASATLKQQSG